MTENLQAMARRLYKAIEAGGRPDASHDALLDEIARRYGRDAAIAVLKELRKRALCMKAEAEAELKFVERLNCERTVQRLLVAAPEGTAFHEGARIMASRGDVSADDLLALFESRGCRLEMAQIKAAVELHPGWHSNDDGRFEKLDDSAPEPLALIEWLYKNHPKRAREIEDGVK